MQKGERFNFSEAIETKIWEFNSMLLIINLSDILRRVFLSSFFVIDRRKRCSFLKSLTVSSWCMLRNHSFVLEGDQFTESFVFGFSRISHIHEAPRVKSFVLGDECKSESRQVRMNFPLACVTL